jgi:FLYWCH zinc finger domain.
MEFIQTERNSRKLFYNGYLYVKNKTFDNGNTYWECEERRSGNGCRVKVLLDEGENFVRITGDHTHAPNPERSQALNIRAQIRRESRLLPDRRTNNIVARNIAIASEGGQLTAVRNSQTRYQEKPIPDRHDYR